MLKTVHGRLHLLILIVLLAACSSAPEVQVTEITRLGPTREPTELPGKGRCGDGVCDGPEDAELCPQDCATPPSITAEVTPEPDPGDPCAYPNPRHAIVSQDLVEDRDWLHDGGFETAETEVVLLDPTSEGLERGVAVRTPVSARSGHWGYEVHTGPGQGIQFGVKGYVEKGEKATFTYWLRNTADLTHVKLRLYWVEEDGDYSQFEEVGTMPVGTGAWFQIGVSTRVERAVEYAMLAVEVEPGSHLYIDDAAVELPQWRMAAYDGPSRQVGGIPVPQEPIAPVQLSFLIHIEDPAALQNREDYFRIKSAVFEELARVFHQHGGFLTIQPEGGWVQGAALYEPDLLPRLAADYDVRYSTHTHGPACRDDQGILRSAADCGGHPDWDRALDGDDVVAYVADLRALIEAAAGVPVTDHNGNFEFAQPARLAEAGLLTWSAFKDAGTQSTYDYLINNPWRPTNVESTADQSLFLTHHPETPLVYIPGWGQTITRHHERLLERLRPMVSQFIYFASPQRVNTFYAVTHVDLFASAENPDEYIRFDQVTGGLHYSDAFLTDLAYWDQMLEELIDPLVAEGYLSWTSLPQMGELYLQWEADCAK